mmetsp:Transcript_30670/g.71958  ORF Transcript_30670/g.71958 Transcript_30670/m.71958 type:complete len:300 (-) Transcript_30670:54-953(-)
MLEFVATDSVRDKAPYYLYSTQLRLIFHRLFSRQPQRPVVGLLNYCTSGGSLEFLRRPSVVQTFGVDNWPLFLMSSTGKSTNSLVAGLWLSIFHRLSILLRDGNAYDTFQSLFDAAVCAYHKDNVYELLNECKARAYSHRVWELEFGFQNPKQSSKDPWHTDLRDCLLATENGEPNLGVLRELQHAYTSGEAFRVVHRDKAKAVMKNHQFANHPTRPGHVIVWARHLDSSRRNAQGSWWSHIPHSRPYKCTIEAMQGDISEADLASIVLEAFSSIARPEFACGINSGISLASVVQTLGS